MKLYNNEGKDLLPGGGGCPKLLTSEIHFLVTTSTLTQVSGKSALRSQVMRPKNLNIKDPVLRNYLTKTKNSSLK